nr:immunoglobulin heavy chain junction region [Macaca mulatta]MOX92126.1 immunoglobulin heavy chain junction region [Macaca mulatta]MOX92150.1 immunoglobulin heavy chain junction region [Macaca mulatta]MOX92357.1 immunoglobulin heavy chain junction region [Macaca mulatta]MOX92489.1 immunoglobulin heavy chain junction region [Macaca mulatta]
CVTSGVAATGPDYW